MTRKEAGLSLPLSDRIERGGDADPTRTGNQGLSETLLYPVELRHRHHLTLSGDLACIKQDAVCRLVQITI